MFGYQNFSKDVLSVFDESFINNYRFILSEERNDLVKFVSSQCIFYVTIDGLVIEGIFLEPNKVFLDNEYYPRSLFMDFKNIKYEILTFEKTYSDVRDKLLILKSDIEQYCAEIISDGNFLGKRDFNKFLKNR